MSIAPISRRGQWRDQINFRSDDGLPIDLTTATIRLDLKCQQPTGRRDFEFAGTDSGYPRLSACTDGTGTGALSLLSPTIAEWLFSADQMRALWTGTYTVSVTVTIGDETEEAFRDNVVIF